MRKHNQVLPPATLTHTHTHTVNQPSFELGISRRQCVWIIRQSELIAIAGLAVWPRGSRLKFHCVSRHANENQNLAFIVILYCFLCFPFQNNDRLSLKSTFIQIYWICDNFDLSYLYNRNASKWFCFNK